MLRFKAKVIDLKTPIIMGILNLTPDSFYDGGKYKGLSDAISQTQKLLDEGASIIDIGAHSTRPGAEAVSEEEELLRLEKFLPALIAHFPNSIFSIDTYRSKVAQFAIDNGVEIVNDVSGGNLDSKMFDTVINNDVYYVLMHMRGSLENMQTLTQYNHLTNDVISELQEKIQQLNSRGFNKIILDPGFGFSKTIDQNYKLMSQLKAFDVLNLPLLVGISRKSMIWKELNITPKEAMNATTVLNSYALLNGAKILRVHDVKEAKEAVHLINKLKHAATF